MTLVQLLADETSIHMSCDFRLTDSATNKLVQDDAHKLIEVTRRNISAIVGITGVALFDGKPVARWVAEIAAGLDPTATVDDLVEVLRQRAEPPLAQVRDVRWRRTTFVVAAIVGSQSIVTYISNFQAFANGRIESRALADSTLAVTSVKPKGPQLFTAGAVNAVTDVERQLVERTLRAGAPDDQIQKRLSEVNAAASQRTPTISAGCYAASLHATGRGSSQPFLTDEQQGDFIPPDAAELFERIGFRIKPAIGPDGKPLPLRVVGATSVTSRPSDKYFREQLKLQPDSAELWNSKGAYLNEHRRHVEAAQAFQRAIELDKSFAIAIANLAKTTWVHQGNLAEAERLYNRALAISDPPTPSWMLADFADLLAALGETDRALTLFRRAAEDEADRTGKARLAFALAKYGEDTASAATLFAEVLASDPENAFALRLAGEAEWFYQGDREAAQAKLLKAVSLNPRDARSLTLAGDISLEMEDGYSAAYYYRKAMRRGVSGWVIESNYGLALLLSGKPDGALRWLNRAQKRVPTEQQPMVQVNLAATWWALGQHRKAEGLLRGIVAPPHIELEALAILVAVGVSSDEDAGRLRRLVELGHRAGGHIIRALTRRLPKANRDAGLEVADLIEGDSPRPPNLI